MDSALKQRLLGAVVLIALAIIFVPMFLSGPPPKDDSSTVDLAIPAPPERKFETRVLPVDVNPKPIAEDNVPESNRVATVDTDAVPKTDAHPETRLTTRQAPADNTDPPPAPVTPPPAEPIVKEASAPSDGRFFVALGVYADHAHVELLVAKMKKLGLTAVVEATEYQGKPAERVRVGAFADRATAETVRLRIKQADAKLPASVVESAEQPTHDAPENAVPANHAGGWAVQLGAFKSAEEANKLRDRLRTAGFAGFVEHTTAALWRVRVGPEVERANADKLRATLKQKFQIDGIIVAQP